MVLMVVFGGVQASRALHLQLLRHVLASPLSFFDSTPVGRIVNRFSKDTDTIDVTLPFTFQFWLMCLFRTFSLFVVLGVSLRLMLTTAVPVVVLYYVIQVPLGVHLLYM